MKGGGKFRNKDGEVKIKFKEEKIMFSLGDVSKEIFNRVDQGDGPPLTKSGIYEIVKATFDIIGQAVAAGEDVSIPQFGKFINVTQKAKNARNPKTGKKIKVPEKQVPKFRVSSVFRTLVIEGGEVPEEETKPKKKKTKKKKK